MSRTTVTPDESGLSITGPVDGVTAGGGGRCSDRRGGRIPGDEPEGTTDVCGERIRFGRQVREEVMV